MEELILVWSRGSDNLAFGHGTLILILNHRRTSINSRTLRYETADGCVVLIVGVPVFILLFLGTLVDYLYIVKIMIVNMNRRLFFLPTLLTFLLRNNYGFFGDSALFG